MLNRNGSTRLSIPKSQTVRGYEIKRLPLGAYLDAIDRVQEFPAELAEQLSPDGTLGGLLGALAHVTPDTLPDMVMRALRVAPRRIVGLLSCLTGIAETALLTDENLGLNGLAELASAWLEVNEIENFTQAARLLAARLRRLIPNAGSKS